MWAALCPPEDAPARRAVGKAQNDVDMKARFAVVADRNVPDRTQDFALFVDWDLLIDILFEIEPSDDGLLKGTDGRQGCRRDLSFV